MAIQYSILTENGASNSAGIIATSIFNFQVRTLLRETRTEDQINLTEQLLRLQVSVKINEQSMRSFPSGVFDELWDDLILSVACRVA